MRRIWFIVLSAVFLWCILSVALYSVLIGKGTSGDFEKLISSLQRLEAQNSELKQDVENLYDQLALYESAIHDRDEYITQLADTFPNKTLPARVASTVQDTFDDISIILYPKTRSLDAVRSYLQNLFDKIHKDVEVILLIDSYDSPHDALKFNRNLTLVWLQAARFTIEEAYNLGAKKSERDFLLFLSDEVIVKKPEWLKEIKGAFTKHVIGKEVLNADYRPIGIATGKIVNKDGFIYSAGLDCRLNLENTLPGTDVNVPECFNRLQGFKSDYQESNQVTEVYGAQSFFFMTRRRIFKHFSGFNTYQHSMNDANTFSMKIINSNDYRVIYMPGSEVEIQDYHEDDSTGLIPRLDLESRKLWIEFSNSVKKQYQVARTVAWDVNTCGCSGFWTEYSNFIVPLEQFVPLKTVYPSHCYCRRAPKQQLNAIERMRYKDYEVDRAEIFICHKKPHEFPRFPIKYDWFVMNNSPDYLIGRPLTEPVPISDGWVDDCNRDDVHEIWVPSQFHFEVFAECGVDESKLVVMPESLDVSFFDPDVAEPLTWLPGLGQKTFKFFSNFKWESRKGWDILLKAYYEEFSDDDDVVLYLQTYLPGDTSRLAENIWSVIDPWREGSLRLGNKKLPMVHLLTQELDTVDIPRLYKTMDCFALPTRAEGWGLPIMEAMAMGLPTIATNWGGNTEFMTPETSYLLDIDGLTDADSIFEGYLWAAPSVKHLRKLMRYIYEHQDEAREVGRRGRKYIVENFSLEVVTKQMTQRLVEVEKILDGKASKPPPKINRRSGDMMGFFREKYSANIKASAARNPTQPTSAAIAHKEQKPFSFNYRRKKKQI